MGTGDRACRDGRLSWPGWASGCSGGAAVRLDAVLAEQVAQAVELIFAIAAHADER